MYVFMAIFTLVFLIGYFTFFYLVVYKTTMRDKVLRRFYSAILAIQGKSLSIPISYEQLVLNYDKMRHLIPDKSFSSILDLFETIIHYCDTYPDSLFKTKFRNEKNQQIRDFIVSICDYIKTEYPFISIPEKEAGLMRSIKASIEEHNIPLGETALQQLIIEISKILTCTLLI